MGLLEFCLNKQVPEDIQDSDNGLLRFPFYNKNQLTGLSTLKAAASLRLDILDYQKKFYKEAAKEAINLKMKDNICNER